MLWLVSTSADKLTMQGLYQAAANLLLNISVPQNRHQKFCKVVQEYPLEYRGPIFER